MGYWVFGYGSLVWDGWERAFDGERHEAAILAGYRRSFCVRSEDRWGTKRMPGIVLGLEADDNANCIGAAFLFSADRHKEVLSYLKTREGLSYRLEALPIQISGMRQIMAVTAVNDCSGHNYIGNLPLGERRRLAETGCGSAGNSQDYVFALQKHLLLNDIDDPHVAEFAHALSNAASN